MIVRAVLFLLGVGPWYGMHCQEFAFSIAARCSLPLNFPAQPSYYLDLGYADTSWAIDWIRVDHASAYFFNTIDEFIVNDRTRSVGVACGWYLLQGHRLVVRTGLQLRFSRIRRYVGLGFSNHGDGTYVAHSVGIEWPLQVALPLGRSSAFQLYVEAVPGHSNVLNQEVFDHPDPTMRVRNTLSMALLAGFRLRI